jgi:hypothetical protein
MPQLKEYVYNAHEDARRRLRKLAETSLDPLEEVSGFDPAQGYPEMLHQITLQGYLGEIFAAIIAQFFTPFGITNWKVPAFLFRFHNLAFEQLEAIRQTGEEAGRIPGRTGDDCLAFQIDGKGFIFRVLYCESKCTTENSAKLIAEAHKKVGQSQIKNIHQLIEILKDYDDPDSRMWLDALRRLWMNGLSGCERYNLVNYICAHSPSKGDRKHWIPADRPHADYISDKPLEAVELHLHDVEGLVREIYGKKVVSK